MQPCTPPHLSENEGLRLNHINSRRLDDSERATCVK